ncbi:hypothetical protein BDY19DRAFT_989052 [Irpex rosettiformis]|uniref:Uncharacterized protein n=1 Tax=Irpex rosettiformis TaxID=378272 RepID=A0ACB8ULT6_9APHY|nr:hypothetical protein BDY19DRAFT_989052 [Irpex rosettiformis]
MRPTFILTRTFAISALFVGATPLAYGAPIAETRVPSVVVSGVEAVTDVPAHDVLVEVRAPIDLYTVNRVDETALAARSPETEPEKIEARNCNGWMGCRREQETPVTPELEERNCNGYMGCRRKREQPQNWNNAIATAPQTARLHEKSRQVQKNDKIVTSTTYSVEKKLAAEQTAEYKLRVFSVCTLFSSSIARSLIVVSYGCRSPSSFARSFATCGT